MTNIARKNLRNYFVMADVGISGVNFGVVETGSLCILSNEGNARMATTLPKMHIALMGMERLVPTLEDLNVFLSLLPRSATGQKITNYVSLLQSPKKKYEADGTDIRHLILIDNGRKGIAKTNFKEVLYCIRCGACLNVCPVFREIGGHAYNSAYPGPIGSVLSPLLFGFEDYGHLAKASSLCGACEAACPVAVPFSQLIPQVRDNYVRSVKQPIMWTLTMKGFALISSVPSIFGIFQKIAGTLQPIFPKSNGWSTFLPGPIAKWTRSRDFPMAAKMSFRQRYKKYINKKEREAIKKDNEYFSNFSLESKDYFQDVQKQNANNEVVEMFKNEWELLGGVFISCKKDQFEEEFFFSIT
jgi:L-lactate dehydrogenase complex protein LldF